MPGIFESAGYILAFFSAIVVLILMVAISTTFNVNRQRGFVYSAAIMLLDIVGIVAIIVIATEMAQSKPWLGAAYGTSYALASIIVTQAVRFIDP